MIDIEKYMRHKDKPVIFLDNEFIEAFDYYIDTEKYKKEISLLFSSHLESEQPSPYDYQYDHLYTLVYKLCDWYVGINGKFMEPMASLSGIYKEGSVNERFPVKCDVGNKICPYRNEYKTVIKKKGNTVYKFIKDSFSDEIHDKEKAFYASTFWSRSLWKVLDFSHDSGAFFEIPFYLLINAISDDCVAIEGKIEEKELNCLKCKSNNISVICHDCKNISLKENKCQDQD